MIHEVRHYRGGQDTLAPQQREFRDWSVAGIPVAGAPEARQEGSQGLDSVVCSNHSERFGKETRSVRTFRENHTEDGNALAGITRRKLVDHRTMRGVHWTIRISALLNICFYQLEVREFCELLLRHIVVKAKFVGHVGGSEAARPVTIQEQQHLEPEDSLDLISEKPLEAVGNALFSHVDSGLHKLRRRAAPRLSGLGDKLPCRVVMSRRIVKRATASQHQSYHLERISDFTYSLNGITWLASRARAGQSRRDC